MTYRPIKQKPITKKKQKNKKIPKLCMFVVFLK